MSNLQSIEALLAQDEQKDLLRFSTAGSIDDGKSTLIGRLLYDSKNVYEDTIAAIKKVSRDKAPTEQFDLAFLTDGLKAEREQGITIDVAYRYFSTSRRKFIIADTPGHEQYTRNMATGASTADLSIILIDARHGVVRQTKRHSFIASLLGVKHIIVAVNKMDLVDFSETVFNRIRQDYVAFSGKLRIPDIRFVPMSALLGDNVVNRSEHMPWYRGESALEILESIYIASDHNLVDLRLPVQYVIRPDLHFRGYSGSLASGIIRTGDDIMVLPSRKTSRVKALTSFDGPVECAFPPMSVTVTLEDELDISRGDMLVHRHNLPRIERHFEAMIVWMNESAMDPNRPYLIKHTTHSVKARIDEVRYRVDVNTLNHIDAAPLALNEIGRVIFTATTPLYFDTYDQNRGTGSFILIDTISNRTVAAGMIIDREPTTQLPARMSTEPAHADLTRRNSAVTPAERVVRMDQRPATLWLTGLVGSGKTDVAYQLEKRLFDLGATAIVLDGENLRLGISRELDFTAEGKAEHLRRVSEIARLLNDAGQIVICAFTSPEGALRRQAAGIVGESRFLEVHVSASVEWCEKADAAGLYARARRGELRNFAGVDVPYEPPINAALTLNREKSSIEACVDGVVALLRERGVFPARNIP